MKDFPEIRKFLKWHNKIHSEGKLEMPLEYVFDDKTIVIYGESILIFQQIIEHTYIITKNSALMLELYLKEVNNINDKECDLHKLHS